MEETTIKEGTLLSGRYQLKEKLGKGSFATVWLAYDTVLEKDVAAKIFSPEWAMDTQGIEDFKEEFKLICDLGHPNIVRIKHYDVYDHRPYIIMTLRTRGSAAQFVGKATESQVWQFIEDVASGLNYLHHLQPPIIHQDIKPDNILIGDNGEFEISDFGISLALHKTIKRTMSNATEQERKKAMSGTPAYMGPERFGDRPSVLMASDIWSLGASAYELLENEVPFGLYGGENQHNTQEGQKGLVGKVPAIRRKVSDDLKQLIYSCLEERTWIRPKAEEIVELCQRRRLNLSMAPTNPITPLPATEPLIEQDLVPPPQNNTLTEPDKTKVTLKQPPGIEGTGKLTRVGPSVSSQSTRIDNPIGKSTVVTPPAPRSSKGLMMAIIALIIVVIGAVVLLLKLSDKQQEGPDDILVAADSLLTTTKQQVAMTKDLLKGTEVSLQLEKIREQYRLAATQPSTDPRLAERLEKQSNDLQALVDSCQKLIHLADTISLLYNEGRVPTAEEHKLKQEKLSDIIKTKIAEL